MSTAGGCGRSRSLFEADEEVDGGNTVSDSKDAAENEKQTNYQCSACQRTDEDPLSFTKIKQPWLPEAGSDIWYCSSCTAALYNLRLWAPHPGWGSTPQGAAPWEGAAGRRAWLENAGPHKFNACAPASASDWLGRESPEEGVDQPVQVPDQQVPDQEETVPVQPIAETETLCDNQESQEVEFQ